MNSLQIKPFLLFISCIIFSLTVFAEKIEEKNAEGVVTKRFTKDTEGKIQGSYLEFHDNGKQKIKTMYRDDKIQGTYFEYDENGKTILSGQYKVGQKHGSFKKFENSKLINDEFWYEDVLVFPKSAREINMELSQIAKLPVEFEGEWPQWFDQNLYNKTIENDNRKALQKLREYRYLCNVPYKEVQLKKEFIAHNIFAVKILNKINQLSHFPKNPGMPEDEFQHGYKGTSSSNLAMQMSSSSANSVDMYMNDSDPSNIDRVGHRRWCINPTMKHTGFAAEGKFSAMWSLDQSNKEHPDFDLVTFPTRGYMPASHFSSHYAWNCSFHDKKYEKLSNQVKAEIFPVKGNSFQPDKTPLELNYHQIGGGSFGIKQCLIFRPKSISISPKQRYFVKITGVKTSDGKDANIEYYVEFF